jgi:hypothetical protein
MFILNTPSPREDENPYSLRAITGMHQNAEIAMEMVFYDAAAGIKDPLIKKVVGEINSTLLEMEPEFTAGGTVAAWKSYVAAQEKLHATIEKRVLALRDSVAAPDQGETKAVDCALVKGLGYAMVILNNPGPREDESPYSLRAITGMHQNAEIGMELVFYDAAAAIKNPVTKKVVGEINSTLLEMEPEFTAGDTVPAWKSYVAAQEKLHATIEKRVQALRDEICK